MVYLLYFELLVYFGLLWHMGFMRQKGSLTEKYFAIMQLAYISLFILTGFLLAPPSLGILWTLLVTIAALWAIGYPFARWLYRQLFPPR
jgi:hypothetical protein